MSSVDSYYSDLKVFIGWFHMQERPKDPDAFRDESISLAELAQIRKTDVYEYLTWLMRDRHLGATTRARRLAVIRSFFHYLTVATNQLDMDPTLGVEPPKRKKSLPVYLDIQQAETLLEAPAGAFELRDRTILMLFLTCGLRISELAALDLDSVNKERVRILGKGNKERIQTEDRSDPGGISADEEFPGKPGACPGPGRDHERSVGAGLPRRPESGGCEHPPSAAENRRRCRSSQVYRHHLGIRL